MNPDYDDALEWAFANDAAYGDSLDDLLWEDEDLYKLLGFAADQPDLLQHTDRLAA